MTILIKRFNYSKFGVEGTLTINNHEICTTLEHPDHHLPPGSYPIELEHNEHYERDLPTMPNGANIRPGNGPFNLKDGSIIVGERYMLGVLFKSAEVFDKLYWRIWRNLQRGKKVELRILSFELCATRIRNFSIWN